MPEEMRVFLGYRLDCAQCHHHPFEEMVSGPVLGLAAFFGRLSRTEWTSEGAIVVFEDPAGRVPDYEESEDTVKVLHPRTGEEASPVFLMERHFPRRNHSIPEWRWPSGSSRSPTSPGPS